VLVYSLHPFIVVNGLHCTPEHRALFVGTRGEVMVRHHAKDGFSYMLMRFDSLEDGLAWLVEDEQ
jgi:hypothetical protein